MRSSTGSPAGNDAAPAAGSEPATGAAPLPAVDLLASLPELTGDDVLAVPVSDGGDLPALAVTCCTSRRNEGEEVPAAAAFGPPHVFGEQVGGRSVTAAGEPSMPHRPLLARCPQRPWSLLRTWEVPPGNGRSRAAHEALTVSVCAGCLGCGRCWVCLGSDRAAPESWVGQCSRCSATARCHLCSAVDGLIPLSPRSRSTGRQPTCCCPRSRVNITHTRSSRWSRSARRPWWRNGP